MIMSSERATSYKLVIIVLSTAVIVLLRSSWKYNRLRGEVDEFSYTVFKNDEWNSRQIQQQYSQYDLSKDVTSHEADESELGDMLPTEDSGNYVVAAGKKNVRRIVRLRTKNRISTPIILVWHAQSFMEKNREKHLEFLLGSQCGGCQVTTDRSKIKYSIAVVLFNHADLVTNFDVPDPSTRNPEQVYVFWTRETPAKTYWYKSTIENPRFDPIFNLTLYFRRDADIKHYFGNKYLSHIASKQLESKGQLKTMLETKSKIAVWFVSNCYGMHGATQRMLYAKQLVEAGLKLDKFGKCFHNLYNGKILDRVHEYKFYLAFENSIHCPNYVSEKFWRNGLTSGLVPVVWGPTKADVEEVAPPKSFIHAEDFESPKDLVDYLKYLDSNHTAYMEYHEWRFLELEDVPYEDIARGHQSSFCRLCKRQVLQKHPPKVIPSVSKWLYETNYVDNKCLQPKDDLTQEEKQSIAKF